MCSSQHQLSECPIYTLWVSFLLVGQILHHCIGWSCFVCPTTAYFLSSALMFLVLLLPSMENCFSASGFPSLVDVVSLCPWWICSFCVSLIHTFTMHPFCEDWHFVQSSITVYVRVLKTFLRYVCKFADSQLFHFYFLLSVTWDIDFQGHTCGTSHNFQEHHAPVTCSLSEIYCLWIDPIVFVWTGRLLMYFCRCQCSVLLSLTCFQACYTMPNCFQGHLRRTAADSWLSRRVYTMHNYVSATCRDMLMYCAWTWPHWVKAFVIHRQLQRLNTMILLRSIDDIC